MQKLELEPKFSPMCWAYVASRKRTPTWKYLWNESGRFSKKAFDDWSTSKKSLALEKVTAACSCSTGNVSLVVWLSLLISAMEKNPFVDTFSDGETQVIARLAGMELFNILAAKKSLLFFPSVITSIPIEVIMRKHQDSPLFEELVVEEMWLSFQQKN